MYLIKNGVVHVGDGTILKDCDILTKGSTIQKIGQGLDCPEAEVVGLRGISWIYRSTFDDWSAWNSIQKSG